MLLREGCLAQKVILNPDEIGVKNLGRGVAPYLICTPPQTLRPSEEGLRVTCLRPEGLLCKARAGVTPALIFTQLAAIENPIRVRHNA